MKSCIITGAGSGLGKELAFMYAAKGWFVYLIGRTTKKLEETKNEIMNRGGKAESVVCDLRNLNDIKQAVSGILEKDQQVELVVNNAGIGHFGPFLDMTEQQLINTFSTNVYATIFVTKTVLPLFIRNNKGMFINVISTAGLRGKVNESVYASSKFAVRGFTESLQKEYAESDIRFVAAYMGGMNTPFWEDSNHIIDPNHLRSAKEVAELIIEQSAHSDNIILESKK
ncbi:MAG TPA: SDR family oxidoreductase [Chondromyces sp.]|nr:SDR family oxidoreductase [Chondromyces sp.]